MALVKILAVLFLVSLTFSTGLQIELRRVGAILRNVSLMARIVAANFIIVPVVGVLLAKAFALSDPLATGFLLMAVSPGVPGVLLQITKKGGAIDMAVALLLVLPTLAVVTVPFTLRLILPGAALSYLSVATFATTLILFQLVPLFAGAFLREPLAERIPAIQRVLSVVIFVLVVLILVTIAPRLFKELTSVIGERVPIASLCLLLTSLLVGYLLGGTIRDERRTLAIGTMLRNVGLSLTLATQNFPGQDVSAAVITYFIVQMVVSLVTGAIFKRTA